MKLFSKKSKEPRFDDDEESRIVAAIDAAEEGNTGEVRVHVEEEVGGDDVVERAREAFAELGMSETEERTGVLLYVAEGDRKAGVWAGKGLYEAREPGFWQDVVDAVRDGYKAGDRVAGLEDALGRIGEVLREIAPGEDVHGDELPNVVTTD